MLPREASFFAKVFHAICKSSNVRWCGMQKNQSLPKNFINISFQDATAAIFASEKEIWTSLTSSSRFHTQFRNPLKMFCQLILRPFRTNTFHNLKDQFISFERDFVEFAYRAKATYIIQLKTTPSRTN